MLLRGINVGGKNVIKMADLRTMLEQMKFKDVQTYIQSGNAVFQTESTEEDLEKKIAREIKNTFGHDIPVLLKTKKQLHGIIAQNHYSEDSDEKLRSVYFVLLSSVPDDTLVEKFEKKSYENERFHITDSCVYLQYLKGYANAKVNNNVIEKNLKVRATTRNLKTMDKMLELSAVV